MKKYITILILYEHIADSYKPDSDAPPRGYRYFVHFSGFNLQKVECFNPSGKINFLTPSYNELFRAGYRHWINKVFRS